MNPLRKIRIWFYMLSKRLYKKPTFLALLILIPVLVIGYTAATSGESGVVTIGLTCQGSDPLADTIFNDLITDSQIISFQICDDPQEAEQLLLGGKLDALWIFPEDLSEKIETFAQRPLSSNRFIVVLEREDNIALMLTREKLNASVYPYIAQRVYVHFLRDLAPELSHLSDDQLLEYYHATNLSLDLFEFQGAAATRSDTGFLLSPLRGILGILILLCSLSAAMYYIRDLEIGTFAWVSKRWQFLPELGCQLSATGHISLVCLICLALSGLSGNIWAELALLALYSLCCSVFAMALRQLLGSVNLLGTSLPLVIVASLLICPVFFDLGAMRQLQYLLPPTYYINAIYDGRYLIYLVGYTCLFAVIAILIQTVKSSPRKIIS